jgi:hypothetical protein
MQEFENGYQQEKNRKNWDDARQEAVAVVHEIEKRYEIKMSNDLKQAVLNIAFIASGRSAIQPEMRKNTKKDEK